MEPIRRIASFEVDHDHIGRGIYISRTDGDITTYDLRTRIPNGGDYMSELTMHSVEHMFATLVRASAIGPQVIYFGPMGCQTGFYLLVRDAKHQEVLAVVKEVLLRITEQTRMYGDSRKECGNYRCLSLAAAKEECAAYLAVLNRRAWDFTYGNYENDD